MGNCLTEFNEDVYRRDLIEEGREERRAEGRELSVFQSICEFLSDGTISLEVALKKSKLSKEEFIVKAKELSFEFF